MEWLLIDFDGAVDVAHEALTGEKCNSSQHECKPVTHCAHVTEEENTSSVCVCVHTREGIV
jgi:hypothetical protein